MTKQECSRLVYMLFTAFPQGDKAGEERLRIYEQMLCDLDFELAKAAVGRLIQSARFLPTVAEVREATRVASAGHRRTGLEAWGDVVHAVRYQGAYRVPKFSDPLVEHVVACMSWQELCLGENEAALRARFVEAYEAVRDRENREHAISPALRLQGQELRKLASPEERKPALLGESFGLKAIDVEGSKPS